MGVFQTIPIINTITNPTGTVTSTTIDLYSVYIYSVFVKLTGTLGVTASIYISDDTTLAPNKSFTLLSNSTQALAANFEYNVQYSGYRYMQVQLSAPTGIGTATVFFTGK